MVSLLISIIFTTQIYHFHYSHHQKETSRKPSSLPHGMRDGASKSPLLSHMGCGTEHQKALFSPTWDAEQSFKKPSSLPHGMRDGASKRTSSLPHEPQVRGAKEPHFFLLYLRERCRNHVMRSSITIRRKSQWCIPPGIRCKTSPSSDST